MFTPFTLEEAYNLSEKEGVIDLSSACMPAMSLADLLALYPPDQQEKLCSDLLTKPLGYSSQFGDLKLREKLSASLYPFLERENFLITSGASEAIFLVFDTLFAAGDCIIVQQPIYQSLYQIAADKGVRIIDWDCDLENYTWHIDELTGLIATNPDCKAVVINNPNNPTGLGLERAELERIVSLLNGRYLISDEVFRNISARPIPSALELYEQAIVISDLSKSFNMPGLRIGWIACSTSLQGAERPSRRFAPQGELRNPDLLELFSARKNYLSLRSPSLSELIATWVLEKHELISKRNKALLKTNINKLYTHQDLFVDLSNIKRERIMGLSIFPRLKDDFDLSDKLFLAKGEYFASKYQEYCRIGLGKLGILD